MTTTKQQEHFYILCCDLNEIICLKLLTYTAPHLCELVLFLILNNNSKKTACGINAMECILYVR